MHHKTMFWYPAVLVGLVLLLWLIFESYNVFWYRWTYASWETPLKIDHWGSMWLTFGGAFAIALGWWWRQLGEIDKQRTELDRQTRQLKEDLGRELWQKPRLEERLRQLETQRGELETRVQQLLADLSRQTLDNEALLQRVQQLEQREVELTEKIKQLIESPDKLVLESSVYELKDQIRRLQDEHINIPAVYNLGELLNNKLWREGMTPLIQRLFVEKLPTLEGISLEPQGGGYGGSLILQAHLWHGGQLHAQPYIIKIGDADLSDEASNVQAARTDTRQVPAVHSGPLSRKSRDGRKTFTGVVYDFARVRGTIQSFYDFYQAPGTSSEDISRILGKIYYELEQVWYNKGQIVPQVSLCHEYQLTYEKRSGLRTDIARILDKRDVAYQRQNLIGDPTKQIFQLRPAFCKQFPPLPDFSWYDPMCFIEDWPSRTASGILPFYRSVIHGDAHSRNLLIEDNQIIWYIDLSHWPNGLSKKRTKELIGNGIPLDRQRGHTLRDMTKLEADIKFILTPLKNERDWSKAISFELDLLDEVYWGQTRLPEPHPPWAAMNELRKAWVAIQTIRQIAKPYLCEPEDKRPYYWSLLQATLPLLGYTTPEYGGDERRELWQKRYTFTAAGLLCGRLHGA